MSAVLKRQPVLSEIVSDPLLARPQGLWVRQYVAPMNVRLVDGVVSEQLRVAVGDSCSMSRTYIRCSQSVSGERDRSVRAMLGTRLGSMICPLSLVALGNNHSLLVAAS
jgi:hypothetical protein